MEDAEESMWWEEEAGAEETTELDDLTGVALEEAELDLTTEEVKWVIAEEETVEETEAGEDEVPQTAGLV